MPEFVFPSRLMSSLRRLRTHYDRNGLLQLKSIIDACSADVEVAVEHDNWNGGTFGHVVYLFVSTEIIDTIDLDDENHLRERIQVDLNKTIQDLDNEYIHAVVLKEIDHSNPNYLESSNFTKMAPIEPDQTGLWKVGFLRLFISHRDEHKISAHRIAKELAPYGISSFVAHDAIKPMKEWQREILNALNTMEVLLVFLTDDFHESVWTNQEVGFALGKSIPIICLKVAGSDPKGFIGSSQALKAAALPLQRHDITAIHRCLIDNVGQAGRLKEVLLLSLIGSESFVDAISNLQRLSDTADRLTDAEFKRLQVGYAQNSQLHACAGIHNRGNWFKRYLESATGKRLEFRDQKIIDLSDRAAEDEIPY